MVDERAAEFRRAKTALFARAGLRGTAFCRAYSSLADDWLGTLATDAGITDGSGMALVAVGGYGRRELCPGSDLDVTLIHKSKRKIQASAEAVWYPIWDSATGLDHSVRNMKDALAAIDSDLKVILGLLDARLVAGDRSVAAELVDRASERWRKKAAQWLEQLGDMSAERHNHFGEVAFLLEPELKEGEGGLRDLAGLRAVAAGAPVVDDWRGEPTLVDAHQTLLAVRIALHLRTGRPQDRLNLQEQDGVAADLDYEDADALMKAVATAARRVAWANDDSWHRVGAWLAGPARRRQPDRQLDAGIVLRDGEISLTTEADPETDPSLPLRAGAASAQLGVPMSRSTLGRLAAGVRTLDGPWPAEARNALVQLLGAGPGAIGVLEALDQTGVLSRLLPEWEPVRSRPQRNAFHRFTVDRHLCEAAANAAELVRRVRRPDLLLVGAWLHDIGKGYPGDHTEVGIEVVDRIGRRMGFPPEDVLVLQDMVRHHLLLPDVATRRDLADPATADMVAKAVGNADLLELLGTLAEADGLATGPAAWGSWKAGLVNELVRVVRGRLAGAEVEVPPALPTEEHRRLMSEGELKVLADGPTVTVIAPDRPGLMAMVAGVLAIHGLDILSAAAASEDRMAVEVFDVVPARGEPPRWDGLRADLVLALEGGLDLEERLIQKEKTYSMGRRPHAARPAEPLVLFDQEASAGATVVEVRSPNAVGVLHRITRALAEADLDVVTAKVSTLGHEVVDAFYVRTAEGAKVTDQGRLDRLEAALLEQLTRPG
ncbi:MAG: [protein-PII] uridylyltransferase [Acidimicrobiales bacterium]